ncbi:MAG: deoxyuridine 5'-triphosphate nucleotidohydrolase [Bacteroidetes bacterium TMED39]|nr:MAG: deoxyuridine 5'-triphosphate nucleotidohydrolase [Bacteroidetes bacterium TMED39]
MAVEVKIIHFQGVSTPEYQTEGSSGVDLQANITKSVSLKPLERVLIPTGIKIEMPTGLEAQIRPRSGLALKRGVSCLNTPGTIDADYRGEIKVLMVNLSNEEVILAPRERIAQMVFGKIEKVNFKSVQNLSDTKRGHGGYGHTGT